MAISAGSNYRAAMTVFRPALLAALALSAMMPTALAASPKKPSAAAAPAETVTPGAPQSLGKAESWTAYASREKAGRVCYLIGAPQKSEPANFARKSPMAMVTHRSAERISNVVSFVEGYPLKEGSDVILDVGGNKFELFTKDDSAWARTAELDKTIVSVLAKGEQVVVRGIPAKGPPTTDVYPLAGFAKALALIDKACGVSREGRPKPATAPARHHTRKKAKST